MKTQTTEAWPFPKIMPGLEPIPDNDADFEEAELDLDFPDMTDFNKFFREGVKASMDRYRFEMMDAAKEANIGIVHVFRDGEKGGLTIAFKPASKFGSGRMVQVAVATCSIEDHFNKKIGTVVALERFFDGETIELPLLKMYYKEDLSTAVKQAFAAMYSVI